jgi:hypothetical protein
MAIPLLNVSIIEIFKLYTIIMNDIEIELQYIIDALDEIKKQNCFE